MVLILSKNRMIEVFVRSDDEYEFYFDLTEGALIYVCLDANDKELHDLELSLSTHSDRFILIPKRTLYEIRKYMDMFLQERVNDIEVKEKLSEILLSRNFKNKFPEACGEYIQEYIKWDKFFFEKMRMVVIEWLCSKNLLFVFEEDLQSMMSATDICLLKESRGDNKAHSSKTGQMLYNQLLAKAKSYYKEEVLHPKPKRGRPPKKVEKQQQNTSLTSDIYFSIPEKIYHFIYRDSEGWQMPLLPLLPSVDAGTRAILYGEEEEEGISNNNNKDYGVIL